MSAHSPARSPRVLVFIIGSLVPKFAGNRSAACHFCRPTVNPNLPLFQSLDQVRTFIRSAQTFIMAAEMTMILLLHRKFISPLRTHLFNNIPKVPPFQELIWMAFALVSRERTSAGAGNGAAPVNERRASKCVPSERKIRARKSISLQIMVSRGSNEGSAQQNTISLEAAASERWSWKPPDSAHSILRFGENDKQFHNFSKGSSCKSVSSHYCLRSCFDFFDFPSPSANNGNVVYYKRQASKHEIDFRPASNLVRVANDFRQVFKLRVLLFCSGT